MEDVITARLSHPRYCDRRFVFPAAVVFNIASWLENVLFVYLTMLPTPPSSPPLSHNLISRLSIALPEPPFKRDSKEQISNKCAVLAEYYWPRHFERNTVDPASFIDRLMTDYATYESDVVNTWIDDMSLVYRIYKVCLNYGRKKGTPLKAQQAKSYQGV